MWDILVNIGDFLLDAILYILAIFGGIQIFRGLSALLGKFEDKNTSTKTAVLLFYGTIFSVAALFFVCQDIAYDKGVAYGIEKTTQEEIDYIGDSQEQNEFHYDLGYEDGIKYGEENAKYDMEKKYTHIVRGLRDKYNTDLESALCVLDDKQNGIPVSQEDLQNAIHVLTEFYYGVDELF